jgi:hypothetical protein
VGKIDRVLRAILGAVLIAVGVMSNSYSVAGIGLVLLVVGGIGICPIYSIFGINTGCKAKA